MPTDNRLLPTVSRDFLSVKVLFQIAFLEQERQQPSRTLPELLPRECPKTTCSQRPKMRTNLSLSSQSLLPGLNPSTKQLPSTKRNSCQDHRKQLFRGRNRFYPVSGLDVTQLLNNCRDLQENQQGSLLLFQQRDHQFQ